MPIDEKAALNAAISQARLSRREAVRLQEAAERERAEATAVLCRLLQEAITRVLDRLEAQNYPGAQLIWRSPRSPAVMAGWLLDAEVHHGLSHRPLYLGSDGQIRTARGKTVDLDGLEKATLREILQSVNELA